MPKFPQICCITTWKNCPIFPREIGPGKLSNIYCKNFQSFLKICSIYPAKSREKKNPCTLPKFTCSNLKMASYPFIIKTLILVLLALNFFTLIYVLQINTNIEELRDKVQKLVMDKEISQISIETDFNKKQADFLREIGKRDHKKAFDDGKLKLEAGEPERLPVAKLKEANAWMGNGRKPRSADIAENDQNAFQVIKVPGSNDFKVVRVSNDIIITNKTNISETPIAQDKQKEEVVIDENGPGAETYLSELPGENVVTMSLWGKDRRYTSGAVRNAELVKRYFPGWKLRVYVETASDHQVFMSVPKNILDDLRSLGADLQFMDPRESRVPPMMWRFLVADDMSVDRFIVRDVDSRLSARDSAAVMAWELSGKPFHCVRDHPSHANYPVSGGMWGGKPAALRNILRKSWEDLMIGFRSAYLEDMAFLQRVIWPKVSAHAYCSDSVSCDYWPSSHPFPIRRFSYEHVGQVYSPDELSRPEDIKILRSTKENTKCVPP